jgi:HD-like signal output (HDOD) protein
VRVNRVLFINAGHTSADAQDALRRGAGRWQMTFASGATQAMAALAGNTYDVVVAEFSPDQADGLDVLAHVKTAHPGSARIVLSEPIAPKLLPRALEVAHQCVATPCEPGAFWMVVERTCFLYGLMSNQAIRGLLGGLDRLPSVPRTYVALTQAMARPEVSLGEIAAIVERDTAMATKVLQLVNSAFFCRPRRISSIPVTVSLLGLERLKALALSTHVFGMLSPAETRAYELDRLQERSLLTAQLALRFLSGTRYADEGFTVGLLQDVGKLLLAVCLKDRYRDVIEQARLRRRPVEVVEREEFDVSHAVVGACMLSVWGLPVTIIEAVAFRHVPSGLLHGDTELVDAVHVADALADAMLQGRPLDMQELALDPNLMTKDAMEDKVRAWCAIATDLNPQARA